MKTKDMQRKEKINKYDLDGLQSSGSSKGEVSGDYADQPRGIVKIARDARRESEEEFHTMQEQHNANHALYYFSMISDAAVTGRTSGNDCEKVRRIIEHMMSLREFIGDEKENLKDAINALLGELRKFCPVRRRHLNAFIYKNWSRIVTLAEAYGHRERCFPQDKYQKLHDVVTGRCYLASWWWMQKISKIMRQFKSVFREVTK